MDQYIQLLRQLIAIPSTSREEKAAADCLEQWLAARGHDVHRRYHNVWMESEPAGGDKPTILLNAHLDTVKASESYIRDPYSADIEGDRLYGLGSNDDGGCLVSMIAAYERLISTPQPYRLVFSATAQEEISGAEGLDAVLEDFGHVDFGIIGEPTLMQMAVAERGLIVLDCQSAGKSGHAARNEGVNAIYEAMRDIEWFRTFNFPKMSPYLGEVKMTVTLISAGTLHNVVPDRCCFTVDVRPNGEYTNEEILSIIKENVRCQVKPRSMRHNSSSIAEMHPAVQKGISLGLGTFGSPTTSNQTRCPFTTLKLGPGDSARSHSADEYIMLSEIINGTETYVRLLDGLILK